MLKNLSQLEHAIEGKIYHFMCDSDSPLNHVKDALFQFMKYAGQVEDAVKAQQQQALAAEIQPLVPPAPPMVAPVEAASEVVPVAEPIVEAPQG